MVVGEMARCAALYFRQQPSRPWPPTTNIRNVKIVRPDIGCLSTEVKRSAASHEGEKQAMFSLTLPLAAVEH